MNGYNIMFTKSTDHGVTGRHPWAVRQGVVERQADPGDERQRQGPLHRFNGPTGGDPYVSQSHDFGATWPHEARRQRSLLLRLRLDVAADGTIYFGESAILYGGGGNKGTIPTGTIDEHVFVSTNNGASFTDRVVASVLPGIACVAAGCTPDYYLGHHALAADAAGKLVMLYDGATAAGGLRPSPRSAHRTRAPHGARPSRCP